MRGTKVVKEDPTVIFLVALTKKAVAEMARRQGRYYPQGPGSSGQL